MNKHKNKIIAGIILILVLITAFFCNSEPEVSSPPTPTQTITASEVSEPEATPVIEPTKALEPINTVEPIKEEKVEVIQKTPQATEALKALEPTPEIKPSETPYVEENSLKCTISVKCDSILQRMSDLAPEKAKIVPKDGIILPETQTEFEMGESAFDILFKELKKNNIHLEFSETPALNSIYIEGIANIYEFDCGDLSGWFYKVNDSFKDYGSSQYKVKDGDKIEFLYSCNFGADIGKTFP